MMVISGLAGIIIVPKMTAMSDRAGRKPLFMVVLGGTFLCDFILFLCVQFPAEVDYRLLLFKSIIEGVAGTFFLEALSKYFVIYQLSHIGS
jgi:hypothetical protein